MREADDVEAVEEVFAEASVADGVVEVGVGGGDDADVDGQRARFAERRDLARLEEAEELRLEVESELADLVEEERAVAGGANEAGVVAVGAGEGAAAVAEQLAFEQVARDGGAVEGDEGFLGAVGEVVDRAGEDFLAGAALAGDEDVDFGPGDACGANSISSRMWPEMTARSPSRGRSSTGQRVERSSRSFLACSSSFRATSINRSAWTVATASIWGFTLSSITERSATQ